ICTRHKKCNNVGTDLWRAAGEETTPLWRAAGEETTLLRRAVGKKTADAVFFIPKMELTPLKTIVYVDGF
ncbi:hypothetical protein, partial [Klebsiella variicola]|uniref:hypothetical protein n=1 Tax=Klebsiella variicola TaxID=244366 RepID=UPI0031D41327